MLTSSDVQPDDDPGNRPSGMACDLQPRRPLRRTGQCHRRSGRQLPAGVHALRTHQRGDQPGPRTRQGRAIMTVAQQERAALVTTMRGVGPDQPTLCGDWTTRDLAAHLVIRERRLDAAPGILMPDVRRLHRTGAEPGGRRERLERAARPDRLGSAAAVAVQAARPVRQRRRDVHPPRGRPTCRKRLGAKANSTTTTTAALARQVRPDVADDDVARPRRG